jgi:hypothetical protein
MIKRKTVFALGAGAHAPYGFPIGNGLVTKIIDLLPTAGRYPNTSFSQLVFDQYGTTIPPQSLVEFRDALTGSGHTSIDSFLATNAARPGFAEIGKLAISYVLLPLDLQNDFSRGSTLDWMSYLFSNMLNGCHRSAAEFLANNSVSFVTFNYDRTLEHFLCVRFRYTYNLSYQNAWETAQQIPLVHVYGSLGAFDPNGIDRRPRPAITPTAFKEAAQSIRLMYDERGIGKDDVQKAKDLISAAECVCFLGFGFDLDNITYLTLNELCQPNKIVFATRYMIPEGDWNRTRQSMLPTVLRSGGQDANPNWDSLGLLQQTQAIG